MTQALMSITPVAESRIKDLLKKRDEVSAGIRIGVKSGGCSGMSYTLEFADAKEPYDDVVELDGISVFIDPKVVMFLIGTELHFEEKGLQSGFVFNNPNEKGRCGCGESFRV